jgi:hypothetical protein
MSKTLREIASVVALAIVASVATNWGLAAWRQARAQAPGEKGRAEKARPEQPKVKHRGPNNAYRRFAVSRPKSTGKGAVGLDVAVEIWTGERAMKKLPPGTDRWRLCAKVFPPADADGLGEPLFVRYSDPIKIAGGLQEKTVPLEFKGLPVSADPYVLRITMESYATVREIGSDGTTTTTPDVAHEKLMRVKVSQ